MPAGAGIEDARGLFGAVFCATDYVTSPILKEAKIIYAVGCGLVTMIIRLFCAYPEGVSFAILFMNVMTPLIDRVVVNRETGFDRYVYELRDNNDGSNTIYIVDEASMISDINSEAETFRFGSGFLLADLLQYVGARPLVFVGDYAQLPPVGMDFSPAFEEDYLQKWADSFEGIR